MNSTTSPLPSDNPILASSRNPATFPNFPEVLTHRQRLRLLRALEREGNFYDQVERMLRLPLSSPGYHTTLKEGWVHPVRESFMYAVALLDAERELEQDRALQILDRLLPLQDTDPTSRTYGIWPWFMEEPLGKMAPPDWNWADFCGAQLLEIALTHGPFLPAPFPERIRGAIVHAARSIKRRNVTVSYTNIAIMGSFVTLAAAETYTIPDLHSYAMDRLRRFHAHTRNHGFSEYNSSTYTVIALDELGRLLRYAREPEARALAEDLYHSAWEEIANHFHVPTRQWAGPQSRAYHTLLSAHVHGLLHRATAGRFAAADEDPAIDEHRLCHVCPPDLEPRFLSLEASREFRQTFLPGTDVLPDTVGTTYLTSTFTLGSVNVGDLWNQRRALVAYWGTAEAPSSLHLRFLHDGYDFSAAHIFSVQSGGDVLAGISFATDGGDTHIGLDMIQNSTILSRDLRLRFEIQGPAASKVPAVPRLLTDPWTLKDQDFHLAVAVSYAIWGEIEGHWECGNEPGKAWLDVVLYSGAEREFRLEELSSAALAFAIRCSKESPEAFVPMNINRERNLHVQWNGLEIIYAASPTTQEELRRSYSSSLDTLRAAECESR